MIIRYLITITHNLGIVGSLYIGAVTVAIVFLVGSAIHKLWSFIRGN